MFLSDFEKSFPEIEEVFQQAEFYTGRMISGSKSGYLDKYYKDEKGHYTEDIKNVVFNANVLTFEDGKVWYGDLDLNKDVEQLKRIAKALGKDLYVLREMDARFGSENEPIQHLLDKSVWSTKHGK